MSIRKRTISRSPSSPASTETPAVETPAPKYLDPDSASDTPVADPAPDARRSFSSRFRKNAVIAGAVVRSAAMAVVAALVVIGAAGFTATGITAA